MMMKPRPRSLHVFSIAAALWLCSTAAATTLLRMSVADMSRVAHLIVRGRCTGNTTGWDQGEIWTFTTFAVDDAWKGSAPSRVTVRLLGGTTGNLTSTVSGVPRFQPGEHVVLFLERTAAGDFSIVSWMQGTFRIGFDLANGEAIVKQDTASIATLDPRTHRLGSIGARKITVGALREQVMAAIEEGSEEKQ